MSESETPPQSEQAQSGQSPSQGGEDETRSGEAIPEDIQKLSFEEALKALEEIVAKLESGEVSLEDSIEIYTRGTHLKRHCENKLKLAEARIEKIALGNEGEPRLEPYESQ